jgi:hypothetical protein
MKAWRIKARRMALLLVLAVLFAFPGQYGASGSVATGKEAFSPLRPVVPTHLPKFAFK